MDTNRDRQRDLAAMNDSPSPSRLLQQQKLQHAADLDTADPAHRQMMPLYGQREGQTRDTWSQTIVQVAYQQVLATQTSMQSSHPGRHSSPPPSHSHHQMPIHRGVKRPLAETGIMEPNRRDPRPTQPRSSHHYPSAAQQSTMPMHSQSNMSSDRSPGMAPPS